MSGVGVGASAGPALGADGRLLRALQPRGEAAPSAPAAPGVLRHVAEHALRKEGCGTSVLIRRRAPHVGPAADDLP